MDTRPICRIVLRKKGGDIDIMVIENLTEAEAKKVFDNLTYPTIKPGFEKILYFKDYPLRRKDL